MVSLLRIVLPIDTRAPNKTAHLNPLPARHPKLNDDWND
jgi:hypothetical protein